MKRPDFGLSRAMDRGRMTHPDVLKGKLSYMAPEMTDGHEATVGVVLWEALSGRKLFSGRTDIDVLLGVRAARIPPLSDLRPDLPGELATLVARALRPDPAERHGSADEMSRELASLLRGVDGRTDGPAIAKAIAAARERLARLPPPQPPPSAEIPL